jgi:FlaA1/EpsC-like NDP-sugar epimerase
LLIGAGDGGLAVVKEAMRHPELDVRPVGFLDDSPDKIGRSLPGYMVLGSLREAERVLSAGSVAAVVFASSKIPSEERDRLREVCRRLSVDIQEVTIH